MSLSTLSSKMRPLLQRSSRLVGGVVAKQQQQPSLMITRPMTVISKKSSEEYKQLNYSERMEKTGRPMSPFLTIYAWPVTAISSITNRVTGVVLSFGCAGLGALELLGGSGTSLMVMQTLGGSGFIISSGAKFAVSFNLIYHYGGAIRHLIWDAYPEYLTNVETEKASWALLGGATILSTGFMFI